MAAFTQWDRSGGSVRAEAAPSWAVKAFLWHPCRRATAKCSRPVRTWLLLPRCGGEGLLRRPQNQYCIAPGMWFCLITLLLSSLLLYFSNHKIAVTVLFSTTLTAELSVRNDK